VDTSLVRPHEGTGIGLALVKELVELHGGSIRAESQEGFGSTFYVRLRRGRDHLNPDDVVVEPLDEEPIDTERPLLKAQEEEILDEMLPSEAPFSEAPVEAPVILVVDDNPDVRAYLKSHLAPLYRIKEAADGREGLEKAREVTPALILSDVMMPEMDGYELCRAIKSDELLNHIPVILLTAKARRTAKSPDTSWVRMIISTSRLTPIPS